MKAKPDEFVNILLNRQPTEEDRQSWTSTLGERPDEKIKVGSLSVIVFRLAETWLALPTIFFKEIIRNRSIHQTPHLKGKLLAGLINLEGELRLCVSLYYLLGLEAPKQTAGRNKSREERMMAITKNEELWVFSVDEIEGVDQWDLALIENIPVTLSLSPSNYFKGIMYKSNRSVGLLDEELLFYSLRRHIVDDARL